MTLRRFLARWGGYVVFVIVFSIGCALLSWWQWSRNAEAQAEVDRVTTNWSAAPAQISSLLPRLDSWRLDDEWRPVQLRGHYLRDLQTLVRNRPFDGRPGFEVLVPLRLSDGRVVVIDRGWIALGDKNDVPNHIAAAPSGEVTVIARLKEGEPELPGRSAPRGQIPTIHLPTMAHLIGEPTYTGAYGLLGSESPAPASAPALQPKPTPDLGPHLSYALQWIAFAVLSFVGLGWAIRQDRRVARAEADAAAGIPPPEPKHPRRRTDAQIEDDLIDAGI